jgi:LysR family transcriptional activator of nhaA
MRESGEARSLTEVAKREGMDRAYVSRMVPLLIPSETNLVQAKLLGWLDSQRLYPRIVGEFDDSALMKVFGQAGSGVFIVPSPIATEVEKHYGVRIIGSTEDVREQYYAISVERRISHPAVSAITETAREWLNHAS